MYMEVVTGEHKIQQWIVWDQREQKFWLTIWNTGSEISTETIVRNNCIRM